MDLCNFKTDQIYVIVFAVSGSGLEFRDSGLGRSQSRDPGIFLGLAIKQDFMLTGVDIG